MTAQASEKIFIGTEYYHLATEPLAEIIHSKGVKLTSPSTALWRGYIGTWRLHNQRLYLIKLNLFTQEGEKGMEELFLHNKPVHAYWFFGTLKVLSGKLLNYVHGGYESTFETDIHYEILKGDVINKTVIKNNLRRF